VNHLQTTHEQAKFFVNRQGANLFSIMHEPRGEKRVENTGIVFCHPVGWEKQYSYRAYAQFGRHLADSGYYCLRFDAQGFGDSDGELVDATIASQVDDTLDAIELLREETSCTRFVLIGVRLGAAVAALAAVDDSVRENIDGLVLVSPVTNGKNYWREWLRSMRLGRMSLGQSSVKTSELLAMLECEGAVEMDGEFVSRSFVEDLKSVDLASQISAFRGACLISELQSGGSDPKNLDSLVNALKARDVRVSSSRAEPKEFWVLKSRYEGYLPRDLYGRTREWLEEVA
jgi:pimeloyl-ACP methyl ester carboxylesterase